jgi:hypothetical protein
MRFTPAEEEEIRRLQNREAQRRYRQRHPEACREAEQISRWKKRDYYLAYWRHYNRQRRTDAVENQH